jgi:hypothetical protein
MTSDHISATMTYVMWREERLWNVSVLQRVHLPNIVCAGGCTVGMNAVLVGVCVSPGACSTNIFTQLSLATR